MKKFAIVIGLVLLVTAGVFAQVSMAGKTFYYKYINTMEDGTGVRSKDSTKDMYITFTSNTCYESDKDGNKTGKVYSYNKKGNGVIEFLFHDKKVNKKTGYTQGSMYIPGYSNPWGGNPGYTIPSFDTYEYEETEYDIYYFMTFSEDYKILNKQEYHEKSYYYSSQKNKTWDKNIYVYNQSSPPAPPPPPSPDGPVSGPKKLYN